MKSEIMNLMTKKVAVDLHGPRGTQHIRCAFGPFVAPSQVVPALATEQKSPSRGVEVFSHDSIGHFRPCSVFNLARVYRVASYVVALGLSRCMFFLPYCLSQQRDTKKQRDSSSMLAGDFYPICRGQNLLVLCRCKGQIT